MGSFDGETVPMVKMFHVNYVTIKHIFMNFFWLCDIRNTSPIVLREILSLTSPSSCKSEGIVVTQKYTVEMFHNGENVP